MIHYRHGRIFTGAPEGWAQSLVVDGDTLRFVGDTDEAREIAPDAQVVDLGGAVVLPGFVDAHTHLLAFGESLDQTDLLDAADLGEIQRRISAAALAAPEAPRLLGRNWLHGALDGRLPDRHMIDVAESDRPVYLDAFDSHSAWVNTAALREMGITADTADPIGGRIDRDPETGEATGLLYETAALVSMRTFLDGTVSDAQRDAALTAAFDHYLRDGVTTAVDMALSEVELQCLQRACDRGGGRLPMRVAAHWLIQLTGTHAGNLAQVERAAQLAPLHDGPWLRITGIKIMVDGVIDSCTAAMKAPFADGSHPGPIWDLDALAPVVAAADAAGLQVAMHAIGDEASDIALAAIEHAMTVNGPRDRRHRIEHLETVTEANVARLAELGVIASMQPVHADPAIGDNWRQMLGDDRVDRGFPWPEFTTAGAVLAFGTDAPTAPHRPLPNLYVATTRRSALDPTLPPYLPSSALPMLEAVAHATGDAAYACRWEALTGRLAAGLAADFVVLDTDPFADGPDSLMTAEISSVVVGGHHVER